MAIIDNTFTIPTQEACNALIGSSLTVDGIWGPQTQTAVTTLIAKIKSIFSSKGYKMPANGNLITGIRTNDIYTDEFTDYAVIIFSDTNCIVYPISTKPGTGLKNPPTVEGITGFSCAVEGFYENVWKFQYNSNFSTLWSKLPYLAQIGNQISVYRDVLNEETIDRQSVVQTGYFGINHHSWIGFVYDMVGNLSEGCQVMEQQWLKALIPYFTTMDKNGFISYALLHKNDFGLLS